MGPSDVMGGMGALSNWSGSLGLTFKAKAAGQAKDPERQQRQQKPTWETEVVLRSLTGWLALGIDTTFNSLA